MVSMKSGGPSELVFGRYQVIRRLAVGGMGEVFLARQSGVGGFDRLVILKSLLPDLAAQEDFVNQFLDEANVAAKLNHPNIVSIYEVGLWNGTYFIAMEYIKGDNLSRLQRAAERQKSAMPLDVAAFIVHDAAHALDHAHKACDLDGKPLRIVHRDVSPQNIMVRTDGVTKVVDFGIAKAANRSSRTATGLLKGKVQYMAPEQVAGEELDGRADQFALGVVLWELIAGRKLFTGNNDIDVLRAVISAPIPRIADVKPGTPPQLARVVDRMLQREREARYPTLFEAASDLKKFLDVSGMKSVQENTAVFVRETLGEEISAKTVDLTPSGANNFVINLAQSAPPPTAPTGAALSMVPRRRASAGIAAGVALSAVMLGVLGAVMLWPDEPVEERVLPVGPAAVVVPPPPPPPPAEKKTARYRLESTPVGATVKSGDVVLGTTPVDTDKLVPGVEHRLGIELDGYEAQQKVVKLDPGESFREVVTLKKKLVVVKGKTATPKGDVTPPPPTGKGFLTLDTKPWAKLYIDGKYVDSTPVSKVDLSAGPHSVRLVNEAAGVEETRRIVIKPGENLKQVWQLKTTSP